MGFEAPTTDWGAPNGSPITTSSDITQGSHSLAVTINGYTEVISTQIAAPGSARAQATFDIKPAQALPWGEARLVVVMPSQGHHWRDLGGVPLTGLTAGQFHTLSFAIPADVQSALESSATDLSFRIIINGPSGSQFIVDNLVVSDGGGSPGDPGTASEAFTLSVPRGSRVQDVIISGTTKVTIDDRSTISEQVSPATVSSIGPERSEFGAGVNVYGNVVSKGDVDVLRSGSQISGTLTTEGAVLQQNNVIVGGGIFTGVPIQNATTEWSVNWPAGAGQNVSLPPDSPNVDLAPGHYGSVQAYSRATITLRSGVYFVDSFVLEPQVNFKVDASGGLVQIYVRDTLRLRTGIEYIGGEEGQVLFGYLGNTPALYEEALVAAVVAPNSAIELRRPSSGLPHKGSFFGKEVHVFSDATVLHIPLDLTFICPSGDFDGDGILNCSDECWDDPAKVVPGICGCGTPDTDTDGDGVPDCVDQCPTDPKNTYRGMCGCADEPDVAPAGTPCNDGIARGTFTCDGEGTCGDPDDDSPEGDGGTGQGGCFHKTLGTTVYWICNGGPTGSTQEDATLTCGRPDRKLARIDTQQENALIATLVGAPSWIGGNDRQLEGQWYWTDFEGADATRFWADGKARPGAFVSWRGAAPGTDDSKNCSTISSDGRWDDEDCNEARSSTKGY